MEGGLFLDVVVGEVGRAGWSGRSVGYVGRKLLTGEDESLLIWRNTFLNLDLSFEVLDGVCWFDIKSENLFF